MTRQIVSVMTEHEHSQTDDPDSVEGPSPNKVDTEAPAVLDLSHNLDNVAVRSDTWESSDTDDPSRHG